MGNPPILLALGANLPSDVVSPAREPAETLMAAVSDLSKMGLCLVSQSRFFTTPCFPAGTGPDYVNAAAVLEASCGMSAQTVLEVLHRVEAMHGRVRGSRWAGRSVDLDLLAFGDLVLPDAKTQDHWRQLALADQARLTPAQLILPHPRLQDRAFVLVPLADVAPDWVHPRLGRSVIQMRDALPAADRAAARPLAI